MERDLDMNTFKVIGADTDSIAFCKADQSPFSEEEQQNLLVEINSKLPEKIVFTHDGIFQRFIVLKAKNYITYDGKKIKLKGSSLKDSKKPVALKELANKLIDSMIEGRNDFHDIYMSYINEALAVKDISRWASKKTITAKVMNAERTTEQKVLSAIDDTEYVEGDKCLMFFKKDKSLCLAEKFDGDYDEDKILEQIFKSVQVFASVLPMDQFINYKLKRNKKALQHGTDRDVHSISWE